MYEVRYIRYVLGTVLHVPSHTRSQWCREPHISETALNFPYRSSLTDHARRGIFDEVSILLQFMVKSNDVLHVRRISVAATNNY